MRRALVLLPLAALLSPAASGQDVASHIERFELFNACRPMVLVVEDLSDDADKIALSRESLRAARLYTEDMESADFASLYVNVSVVGRAFHISVWYRKMVTDSFGVFGTATTWQSISMATGDAGYIVSSLSQHLDEFLAAYLRVNEAACGAPAGRP